MKTREPHEQQDQDPRSLDLTPSSNQIVLVWAEPRDDGGSNITGYRIDISTNGSSFTRLVARNSTRTYTHTGLSGNTTRYYRIYSINSVGTSTIFLSGNETTDAPIVAVPSAPQNLVATASGTSRIVVTWDVHHPVLHLLVISWKLPIHQQASTIQLQ